MATVTVLLSTVTVLWDTVTALLSTATVLWDTVA